MTTNCDSKKLCGCHLIQKSLFFVVVLLISPVFCSDINEPLEEESAQFDVKPGGQIFEYKREWDGFKCKFIYSCQGGTKEEWMMTLKRSINKKNFKCIVLRPSGKSYLYFQEFTLQVKGPQIHSHTLLANNGRLLRPEEFTFNKSKNSISQTNGKFKSELTLIEVVATRHKKKKEL